MGGRSVGERTEDGLTTADTAKEQDGAASSFASCALCAAAPNEAFYGLIGSIAHEHVRVPREIKTRLISNDWLPT